MLFHLIWLGLFLGPVLSATFGGSHLKRIFIREEGSQYLGEIDDITLFTESSISLATADVSEDYSDLFSLTSSATDSFGAGGSTVDYTEENLQKSSDLSIPNDSQFGDLLAFHDGDLPPPGWGDCDFPKMPACCLVLLHSTYCIWFTTKGPICPDTPAEIFPPRTREQKEQNQAVCCDQVVATVGIGCVPVRNRAEEDVEEEDISSELNEFNNLQSDPIPGTCESVYRRSADEKEDESGEQMRGPDGWMWMAGLC